MDTAWDSQPHLPYSRGERAGKGVITDHACVRKLHKIPTVQDSGSLQVGGHVHTGKVGTPDSTGTDAPVL